MVCRNLQILDLSAMHRKIIRQSRRTLRRASDKGNTEPKPPETGEGVETGWRAPRAGPTLTER